MNEHPPTRYARPAMSALGVPLGQPAAGTGPAVVAAARCVKCEGPVTPRPIKCPVSVANSDTRPARTDRPIRADNARPPYAMIATQIGGYNVRTASSCWSRHVNERDHLRAALLELADQVIAIDASHAMLRAAQPHSRARYLVAAAERVPLRDAAADLATVAAFHWFDQQRAFAELARAHHLAQKGLPAPLPCPTAPRLLRPRRRAARRPRQRWLRRRRHPHPDHLQPAGCSNITRSSRRAN
jgi:methyltransferase family protein